MRPGLTPRLGSGVLVRVLACAPSCFSGWSQRWPPPSASRGKCARDDCCHQPDDFGIPRRNPAGTSIQPRARPSCLFSESSSDTDPICSPYASDIELNVSVARRFCRQAVDGGRSRPHPTCCSRSSWANPASRIWRCSWVRAVEQMRGHMDRHHPEQVDLRLPIRGSVNLSMLALQACLG